MQISRFKTSDEISRLEDWAKISRNSKNLLSDQTALENTGNVLSMIPPQLEDLAQSDIEAQR